MFHRCRIVRDSNDLGLCKYMFGHLGYNKVIKLDTSLGDPREFQENVREFADTFEFSLEERDCSGCLTLLTQNYYRFKEK